MLWPIKVFATSLALARDTTMRPSCCSMIVVRQSSARLQGSCAPVLSAAVAPAEPDREARLEASPRPKFPGWPFIFMILAISPPLPQGNTALRFAARLCLLACIEHVLSVREVPALARSLDAPPSPF